MIKQGVQAVLKTFGYRLARADSAVPFCGLSNFFPLLKRFGFSPAHILDVGANRGKWTREAVKYFPQAHYTLVEPQADLKSHVMDLIDGGFRIHWINAGASDQPGTLPLRIIGEDHSSTFVKTARIEGDAIRQIEVPLRTVNEIVASSGLPVPAMVKIDAEGFDLKVIAGASELFGKTEIFLAEASVGERDFENSALAVLQLMDQAGYRLLDVTDLNRSAKSGLLWLTELAFLKKTSTMLDSATRY